MKTLTLVLVGSFLGMSPADQTCEDLRFEVVADSRTTEVDKETIFKIKIENRGDAPACAIQVAATCSANLRAVETAGTDSEAMVDRARNRVIFPDVASLGAGAELVYSIKVRAVGAGIATCEVEIQDQHLGATVLRKTEHLRILQGEVDGQ